MYNLFEEEFLKNNFKIFNTNSSSMFILKP